MQTSEMNKLAEPDCPHCVGAGRVLTPITLKLSTERIVEPPPGKGKVPGFAWVKCGGCGGKGRR